MSVGLNFIIFAGSVVSLMILIKYFPTICCGRAMLRHEYAVASWAGSNVVIPPPPPPLKGRQRTCDSSGVAGVHERRWSLTIRQSVRPFALLFHKKKMFSYIYYTKYTNIVFFLWNRIKKNIASSVGHTLLVFLLTPRGACITSGFTSVVQWFGFEPATTWSQVRRPSHYATAA